MVHDGMTGGDVGYETILSYDLPLSSLSFGSLSYFLTNQSISLRAMLILPEWE